GAVQPDRAGLVRERASLGHEHVLARGADADELDGDLQLALDELDVRPGGVRQVAAGRRVAEGAAPAGQHGPDRLRVMEVALVRREVRRLGAVSKPVADTDGE